MSSHKIRMSLNFQGVNHSAWWNYCFGSFPVHPCCSKKENLSKLVLLRETAFDI